MVTSSRYLINSSLPAAPSATNRSVPAMVTLNFGGHLTAITFVRSFVLTMLRKRTFESVMPPRLRLPR